MHITFELDYFLFNALFLFLGGNSNDVDEEENIILGSTTKASQHNSTQKQNLSDLKEEIQIKRENNLLCKEIVLYRYFFDTNWIL